MPFLRQLLWRAAAKVASDPELRAKAAEVVNREVVPRAEAAWEQTKPKLEAARQDVREVAEETDPRKHPALFAGRVTRRLRDRARGMPGGGPGDRPETPPEGDDRE